MGANVDVWRLFSFADTQWRVGPMGVVGLDYTEARHLAEDVDIVWDAAMLHKVRLLERLMLARRKRHAEDLRADDGHQKG